MSNRKSKGQRKGQRVVIARVDTAYEALVSDIRAILDRARHATARAVNAAITATYWDIGRRIVEFEQAGHSRAEYGERTLSRLASELASGGERGFSVRNLQDMRLFYQGWPIQQTVSANSDLPRFPLPWSAYVRLLSVQDPAARAFYETEALRGGWSVRQLDRQIATKFFQRHSISKDKARMLHSASAKQAGDELTPAEVFKDPYILEFLDLKDEYPESELEGALTRRLEDFLLELGGDFTFVGRQRRMRIGDAWFRVDLVFYHRGLRCLVLIDLKVGEVTAGDIGQMNMYVNYAHEHWTGGQEVAPVGLVLGTSKHNHAMARYTLGGLENKIMAAEYETVLPNTKLIEAEVERVRMAVELAASVGKPANGD